MANNNPDPILDIHIQVDSKGHYINITASKIGTSEYMGLTPLNLTYLFPLLNAMLDNSIHLSGKKLRLIC